MIITALQEKEKTDKEIIYSISGICGISHRTASEQFKAFKAQKTLADLGIDIKTSCEHEWSNYFSTPGGLAAECRLCGAIKKAGVENAPS